MKTITLSILLVLSINAFAQVEKAKLANEYFQRSEYDKARVLFQELDRDKEAIPLIQANYLSLLLDDKNYAEAEKFMTYALKHFPSNYQYQISLLKLYQISGQPDEKDKYFRKLEKDHGDNQYQLNLLAQHLANQQMYEEAIYLFEKARRISNNPSAFALDLAGIYRMTNDKEKMTSEYLNYAESNPRNIAYVKNLFQSLLGEEDDQEYLENTLIEKIQNNPDETLYPDLLIWLELQRKNFYAAFVQAKALDKRKGRHGSECMQIGRIAMDNKSWDIAVEVFEYLIKAYPESVHYPNARTLLIEAKENRVKNQYPIDTKAIRNLANEYQALFREMGPNHHTLEALRNKAMLHAFYLNEKDSAINILNTIIGNMRAPHVLVSKCKLDLGDIYLLDQQPWESTLLYSQVEKSDKESPIGYEAKLKNAKLNYYTGNFSLAKDHLDILKLATTREISNDAIALSLLIQNNTVFDTTDQIMQQFANIELLIFQNFKDRAERQLNEMLENHPTHSLVDEIYWVLAQLELEKGNYQQSVSYLSQIIDGHGYDILGDDAMFKKGKITAEYLKADQDALNVYVEFLKRYPGSLYAAEVRAKVRKLRGDRIN